METETIGARLRQAREMLSLRPQDLALEYNLGAQSIRDYETGHRKPGALALIELCDAYGITSDYILGIKPARRRR